jgi:TRAP-type C4-dicarboxylate transport system permease large subunit
LLLAITKGLRAKEMFEVILSVGRTSAPLLLLLFTAQLYSRTMSMTGITGAAKAYFLASGLGPYEVLAIMIGIWFLLGCIIDSVSIILLTVPVFAPIAQAMGFDPIAFAIMGILAIETGLLTPPFGLLVFTVKVVLPHEATVGEIFRASLPYWICLLTAIVTIAVYPPLATWLPYLGSN